MGEETDLNTAYKSVYQQFHKGNYKSITCSGEQITVSLSDRHFSKLFDSEQSDEQTDNFDLQTKKYLLIRWFSQKNDNRFLNYFNYYYQPTEEPNLSLVSFETLVLFMSPINEYTLKKVFNFINHSKFF
jgi:hypothetical protein